jgi:hypothetical protein
MHLSIRNPIHDKPIAKVAVNSGKLKSGVRHGFPLSPLLFNTVLQFLARAIRQGSKMKGIQIGKKEVKSSLFIDDILYLSDAEDPNHKILICDKYFRQSSEIYITNIQKSVALLYTNDEQAEKEMRTIPFTMASKQLNTWE